MTRCAHGHPWPVHWQNLRARLTPGRANCTRRSTSCWRSGSAALYSTMRCDGFVDVLAGGKDDQGFATPRCLPGSWIRSDQEVWYRFAMYICLCRRLVRRWQRGGVEGVEACLDSEDNWGCRSWPKRGIPSSTPSVQPSAFSFPSNTSTEHFIRRHVRANGTISGLSSTTRRLPDSALHKR